MRGAEDLVDGHLQILVERLSDLLRWAALMHSLKGRSLGLQSDQLAGQGQLGEALLRESASRDGHGRVGEEQAQFYH